MKNLKFTGLKYSYKMFRIVNNCQDTEFAKYQWMVRLDGSPVFEYRNQLIMFDDTGVLYYCKYSYCQPMTEEQTKWSFVQNRSVKMKVKRRKLYAIIGEYQFDVT